MSLFGNISFGGSDGNTSAFGDLANSAIQGGTAEGGFDTGDAANAALDAAASAIPFGATIKKFLDQMGLARNVELLGKYGFSSWGASTSPEEIKGQFGKKVYPFVEGELKAINAQNFEEKLNFFEDLFRANYYYQQALRDNHSKAKSTRLAHDWAAKEFKKILDQVTTQLISTFKSYGVKVQKVKSNEHPRQMDIYEILTGNHFTSDRDLDNYLNKGYNNYIVDYSDVKQFDRDKDGKVVPKKSSGLLTLGLGVWAAVKGGLIKM